MALKDWKKTNFKDDEGLIRYKKKGEPEYYKSLKDSHDILVYPIIINYKKKGWQVHSNMFGDKNFKTKAQAMKFAKDYMKKH